jgi:hypothetical protein
VAGVVGAAQDATRTARSTRGAVGVVGAARGRKPGGTVGVTRRVAVEAEVAARGAVRGAALGEVDSSSELGTSSSVAPHGAVRHVRREVPMGETIGVSFESKKNPNRQLDGAR